MKIVGLVFEETKEFVCPVCRKAYKTQANLDKHMEENHPDPANPPAQGTDGEDDKNA